MPTLTVELLDEELSPLCIAKIVLINTGQDNKAGEDDME